MDLENIARKGVLWVVGLAGAGGGVCLLGTGIYNDIVGGVKATAASVSSKPDANQRYLDGHLQERRGGLETAGGLVTTVGGAAALLAAWPQKKRPEEFGY